MTLTRRCPRCKSKALQDSLVTSKKHSGGKYWTVKCCGCNGLLSNWELVDEHGKTIAMTSCESRAVICFLIGFVLASVGLDRYYKEYTVQRLQMFSRELMLEFGKAIAEVEKAKNQAKNTQLN
jgi:hypothetical protein